ncbi:MAG: hypothetical protein GC162_13715 [Planctomycetes bacterium]|nr:hypothetical protein [Planctomycetota bacterium]
MKNILPMLIVALAAGVSAWGADPTLDELLNIPVPTKPDAPAKPDAPKSAAPEGDKPIMPDVKVPGEDAGAGDAFKLAVTDMRQAGEQIADAHDTGLDTQRTQERVIARLDQLISELSKQQQSSKKKPKDQQQDTGSQQNQQQQQQSQQQANSQEAAKDTTLDHGQVENGRLNDEPLTEKLSEWGNLPPRLRDQLLQGLEDRFSQLYRNMTERYYRRLGEQGN